MMDLVQHRLKYYIDRINYKEPFALSRYGDGEFAAMFGMSGHNCDGHEYYPEMGEELRQTIEQPKDHDYEYGIVRIAYKVFGENRVMDWINQNAGDADITLADGTVMVDASRMGRLYPLIECLREKRILYVGPSHLNEDSMDSVFEIETFISVLPINSYDYVDQTEEIIRTVCTLEREFDLIGFSAGPTTEILMWRLWDSMVPRITMIDFGSLWDGFVGVQSRKYHRDVEWQDLIKKNLTGKRN